MKINSWDLIFVKWFVTIVAFCNIIVIVELLGNCNYHFGLYTRIALSGCAIYQGVFVCYFVLRMISLVHGKDKKEEKNERRE